MEEKLLNYRKKLVRRLERNNKHIKELEDKGDSLSIHGYWSLGYHIAISSEIENEIDEIDDILKIHSEQC